MTRKTGSKTQVDRFVIPYTPAARPMSRPKASSPLDTQAAITGTATPTEALEATLAEARRFENEPSVLAFAERHVEVLTVKHSARSQSHSKQQ